MTKMRTQYNINQVKWPSKFSFAISVDVSQGVLTAISIPKMNLLLILAFIVTAISARPQFFPSEPAEGTIEDEIEGRHFIHHHRRPYNQGRPFMGHFNSFGGPTNTGLFPSGAGNFGPSGQIFGSNMGGSSATGIGMANSGLFGTSATGFGSASAGNGGGSAIGFGSANAGNGGTQATGIGIAQAPLGGFGMGVGLSVITPFGNMAQGQGFSIG